MSWCRWGSPCHFTFPPGYYKVDVECAESAYGCLGSDLYIFEIGDNRYTCCGCRLDAGDGDFEGTHEEMEDHIEKHVAAGHHVRQSLRKNANLELSDRYKGTIWDVPNESNPPGEDNG